MPVAAVGRRCLVQVATLAASIGGLLAMPEHVRAQEAWPAARCYELTLGRWQVEGDTTGHRMWPPPIVPEMLILEDARVDSFIWFRTSDPADTAKHVVHGQSRDPRWSDAQFDPSFVWWHRPERDTLVVLFGTGFGGIDFAFRTAGDVLRGSVGTHSDTDEPLWRASATGRRVRCPIAPPRLGRLRLAVRDTFVAYSSLPHVSLSLATETQLACGGQTIHYEAIISPETLAVLTLGAVQPRGGCGSDRGYARTSLDLRRKPGRAALLIKHEGDTNRFVVTVTDSSLALTAERATTVVADERVQPRPRHNLFVISCGHRGARALCDDLGTWVTRQPGVVRLGVSAPETSPYSKRVNEDVRSAVFRYESAATLERLRACLASAAEQLRTTDGVYISVVTWLGDELSAAAGRLAPLTPIPTAVTGSKACE
jgi:hypothetical protein